MCVCVVMQSSNQKGVMQPEKGMDAKASLPQSKGVPSSSANTVATIYIKIPPPFILL